MTSQFSWASQCALKTQRLPASADPAISNQTYGASEADSLFRGNCRWDGPWPWEDKVHGWRVHIRSRCAKNANVDILLLAWMSSVVQWVPKWPKKKGFFPGEKGEERIWPRGVCHHYVSCPFFLIGYIEIEIDFVVGNWHLHLCTHSILSLMVATFKPCLCLAWVVRTFTCDNKTHTRYDFLLGWFFLNTHISYRRCKHTFWDVIRERQHFFIWWFLFSSEKKKAPKKNPEFPNEMSDCCSFFQQQPVSAVSQQFSDPIISFSATSLRKKKKKHRRRHSHSSPFSSPRSHHCSHCSRPRPCPCPPVTCSVNSTGPPVITSISPTSGPIGTVITVQGRSLSNITQATVGVVNASFTSISSKQLTVVVPSSLVPSLVNVVLSGRFGVSNAVKFTVVMKWHINNIFPYQLLCLVLDSFLLIIVLFEKGKNRKKKKYGENPPSSDCRLCRAVRHVVVFESHFIQQKSLM